MEVGEQEYLIILEMRNTLGESPHMLAAIHQTFVTQLCH